jgi:predicted PurR-regulated permease PerM
MSARDDQTARPGAGQSTHPTRAYTAGEAPPAGGGNWWTRTGMPPWLPRAILLIFVAWIVAQGAIGVLGRLSFFIVAVVFALFLSFALEPGVNWLVRHGWRRGLATLFLIVVVVAAFFGLLAAMIPLVLQEAVKFAQTIPSIARTFDPYLQKYLGVSISQAKAADQSAALAAFLSKYTNDIASGIFGLASTFLGLVVQLLTVGLLTYYLVAEAPQFRRRVCSLLPPRWQEQVLSTWEVSITKTGGYLYSRALLAVMSGVATFIVLRVLGVPFAVPLAIWMGVISQFIPTVGTYIAALLPLIVALAETSIADFVVLLVFIVVYQQVENYIFSPRISARTMHLHPAIAFAAVIVGGSLFGAVGAFLAIPATAIAQSVASAYVQQYEVVDSKLTRDSCADADEECAEVPGEGGEDAGGDQAGGQEAGA